MDFLTLQKRLQELQLEIFTLNDVVKITEQKKEVVTSTLTRLEKQGKIKRIKKGYYSLSTIHNKFKLQKAYKDTYIGVHSAVEYYESTTQRFRTLDLISKKILKEQDIEGTTIVFHKVKKDMFYGYKKIYIDNTEVFISNIEKTIIDCIYFSSKIYLSEIKQFIQKYKDEIDTDVLERYLQRAQSSVLNKRVGYLLESEGTHIKNITINNKYEKLNINKGEKGAKNKKWKLLINEEL